MLASRNSPVNVAHIHDTVNSSQNSSTRVTAGTNYDNLFVYPRLDSNSLKTRKEFYLRVIYHTQAPNLLTHRMDTLSILGTVQLKVSQNYRRCHLVSDHH